MSDYKAECLIHVIMLYKYSCKKGLFLISTEWYW